MSDLPELSYVCPRTLEEASKALARPGACVYAGGTDLLVALGERAEWTAGVRELVDIKRLEAARGIVELGDALRIGALVTADEIAASRLIRREAPVLAEAAAVTSAPALRRRGTVGGNIVTPHPAGDVTTALLALDATVTVLDAGSPERSLEQIVRPSRRGHAKHLPLILAVTFAKCRQSAFEKLGSRVAFSRSIVAAAVTLSGGRARVALGGVAERPFFAPKTSAVAHAGSAPALHDALVEELRLSDGALAPASYRVSLARALVERAIARARRKRR
jgi:CO/xanthine dehydrogenase FAD-binding subunit